MKSAITALAAVAALAFAAAPASGQELIQHTLDTSADGWQVNVGASASIAVACTAVAKPNALGTGITACYLRGANGARYDVSGTSSDANTGPADATAGATLSVPAQEYEVCVKAHAYYQDMTYIQSDLSCSPVYRVTN